MLIENADEPYAGEIAGEVGRQVWQGIGIQVLFLFAMAGISMAIAKYQQQER